MTGSDAARGGAGGGTGRSGGGTAAAAGESGEDDAVTLQRRLPVTAGVDWWSELVRRAPGGRVLYAGCGVGRLALELAGACRELVAVDADLRMVAAFERRLPPDLAGRVRLVAGRVEALPVGGRFGLALLPSNLLNELPGPDARREAAREVAARCRPDGRVALQVLNPYWLAAGPAEWRGRMQPADGGAPVEVSGRRTSFDPWTQLQRGRLTYRFPDGSTAGRELEAVAVFPAELRRLLGDAGLVVVERWGARPGTDPLDTTTPSWHLVCAPAAG